MVPSCVIGLCPKPEIDRCEPVKQCRGNGSSLGLVRLVDWLHSKAVVGAGENIHLLHRGRGRGGQKITRESCSQKTTLPSVVRFALILSRPCANEQRTKRVVSSCHPQHSMVADVNPFVGFTPVKVPVSRIFPLNFIVLLND